jgi:hypothetical protein
MVEFASAAEAPAARAVIYAMGFDHDMVQHALAQAGGNEHLAIDLILNGEVHDVATASSSVSSIAAPAVSFSGPSFGFGTAIAPAEVASSSSSSSDVDNDNVNNNDIDDDGDDGDDHHYHHHHHHHHHRCRFAMVGLKEVQAALNAPGLVTLIPLSFNQLKMELAKKLLIQADDEVFSEHKQAIKDSYVKAYSDACKLQAATLAPAKNTVPCYDDESSSSSMPSNVLVFPDHLTGRRVSLALDVVADGKLQSPAQLRAQIMRPLEIMQAAAWFYVRQSPDMKRHREEPPPPLGHMLTQFSPCVPVRVMCGCVATACRRLTTAPAGVHVIHRTTGRWAAWIMERVAWGRVRRVQVRLQRRACCGVRCACRASACVRCACHASACVRCAVCLTRAAGNDG